MPNPPVVDHDDAQLKLEMRAMAELLLDIYEYRTQSKDRRDGGENIAVLDDGHRGRTMKERSKFKSNNNIE
jgi:hypothetical protein